MAGDPSSNPGCFPLEPTRQWPAAEPREKTRTHIHTLLEAKAASDGQGCFRTPRCPYPKVTGHLHGGGTHVPLSPSLPLNHIMGVQ